MSLHALRGVGVVMVTLAREATGLAQAAEPKRPNVPLIVTLGGYGHDGGIHASGSGGQPRLRGPSELRGGRSSRDAAGRRIPHGHDGQVAPG
jgi:hypothetical protein